jgi:DNA gyrase/topoisomerase IV subunit B
LGEISPKEFKDFISKDGMRLTQVSIEGDHSVSEILSFYMGKNTPDRREYIMGHLVVDAETVL